MVRPGTGKKPDRVIDNTKEVAEEKNTGGKAPTGIISEKGGEKVVSKGKVEADDDLGGTTNKSKTTC
jgi:hypothetical protein